MAASSTQLACPHCGSTLSFGSDIAVGTPVECLICMQTFAAAPSIGAAPSVHDAGLPTMSDSVTAQLPKTAPAAKAKSAVPVGKPASTEMAAKPKAPIPTAAKANPDAEIFAPPPIRMPASASSGGGGGKGALLAIALGLALLLTGGVVFAVVKITASTRGGDPDKQVAQGPNGEQQQPSNNPEKKPDINPDGNSAKDGGDAQGSGNAVLTPEEDEQLRLKLREETKQLLKRKIPANAGPGEFDWGKSETFNVDRQQATGLNQRKINEAIDKGVVFLKNSQMANGTWNNMHGVGHAAIGGLTLLECNVPANDPAVQRAALFVRSNVGNLNFTYELSLAILFLDRLDDKQNKQQDRTKIQGMAMRLLAGQNDCGGWTYNCPVMTPQEMLQLYNFLQSNKRPNLLNPLQGKASGAAKVEPMHDPIQMNNPFQEFPVMAQTPGPVPKKGKGQPKMPAIRPDMLQGNLQNLPIVRNQAAQKGQMMLRRGNGDNSNTQFALLALWTARRHDVPTDVALLAAFQRFGTSQNGDGGWSYTPGGGTTNTMTSVGLLGMAMGHGASPEVVRINPKDPKDVMVKPALEDPKIQTGLQALARNIGEPRYDKNANFPMQNLYFLWSVERVAMLYDLQTIGGKQWYPWARKSSSTINNPAVPGPPLITTATTPPSTPASPSCSSNAPTSSRTSPITFASTLASANRNRDRAVGWVERSETHRSPATVGLAPLDPPYGHETMQFTNETVPQPSDDDAF